MIQTNPHCVRLCILSIGLVQQNDNVPKKKLAHWQRMWFEKFCWKDNCQAQLSRNILWALDKNSKNDIGHLTPCFLANKIDWMETVIVCRVFVFVSLRGVLLWNVTSHEFVEITVSLSIFFYFSPFGFACFGSHYEFDFVFHRKMLLNFK